MSAEPIHEFGCEEWCNHCTICGTGILYGSLCPEHWNKPVPLSETNWPWREDA